MELNLILQGWLIKSPPENKSTGPFKLFRAKWRRRWFVLYEPLASQSLPGTRAALDYYNNDRRQKKLGSIDLDHCEEVQFKLDSADYKHIFSLRTKHKGNDRTYFLSVDSEAEMMKWVDCLCLALGLKENPEDIEPSHVPLNPPIGLPAPSHARQTTSGYSSSAVHEVLLDGGPGLNYATNPANLLPHNNLVQHTSQKPAKQIEAEVPSAEAYFLLADCYTGERDSSHFKQTDREAEHRSSNDSIPSEPPPAPPVKCGRKLSDSVLPPGDPSLYDSPTKSYVNLGVDNNENVYKIPRADGEGVYKMPRGSSPDCRMTYRPGLGLGDHPDDIPEDQEGLYKVPHSDPVDGHKMCETCSDVNSDHEDGFYKFSGSDDIYKVPPQRASQSKPASLHSSLPDHKGQDVSVFSQVPLPSPSDISGGGVMSRRSPPDGEPSPTDPENSGEHSGTQATILHSDGLQYDVPNKAAVSSLYDTPKSCQKALENNLLESVVPAPAKSQPSLLSDMLPLVEGRYENLIQNVFEDTTLPRMSQRINTNRNQPRSRSSSAQYFNHGTIIDGLHTEKRQSPQPPKSCQPTSMHSYINAPSHYVNNSSDNVNKTGIDSFYMQMSPGFQNREESVFQQVNAPVQSGEPTTSDMYTDMRNLSSQLYSVPPSNRPVNPSVHDVVPPPRDETYVFQTHRTRSFKRPVQHEHSDVVLPTRRTDVSDDVSSSDEESCSSGSQHDKSADSLSYRNYPPAVSTSLAAKMGALNCTPPAPKHQGEIQYLDLALDEQSDKSKSTLCVRSPASGNVSPTDYKEIDFVKTKALNETQKDVESKRKSSERSADE